MAYQETKGGGDYSKYKELSKKETLTAEEKKFKDEFEAANPEVKSSGSNLGKKSTRLYTDLRFEGAKEKLKVYPYKKTDPINWGEEENQLTLVEQVPMRDKKLKGLGEEPNHPSNNNEGGVATTNVNATGDDVINKKNQQEYLNVNPKAVPGGGFQEQPPYTPPVDTTGDKIGKAMRTMGSYASIFNHFRRSRNPEKGEKRYLSPVLDEYNRNTEYEEARSQELTNAMLGASQQRGLTAGNSMANQRMAYRMGDSSNERLRAAAWKDQKEIELRNNQEIRSVNEKNLGLANTYDDLDADNREAAEGELQMAATELSEKSQMDTQDFWKRRLDRNKAYNNKYMVENGLVKKGKYTLT